jgi:Mg2+ and Co2+ transporter CorA
MTRAISGLYTFLVLCSAYAADVKDEPIPETTNVLGIAIFFIVFFGLCIGFFVWMWWKNKHNKEE